MVKVAKYGGAKKKENDKKYREQLKKNKYGIIENLIYAMKHIWQGDKKVVICCFGFALSTFFLNLTDTYINKYVVDLALSGLDRKILIICAGVILGKFICIYLQGVSERYNSNVGHAKSSMHFHNMLMEKCMTTDYENNESSENSDKLNKAINGVYVANYNTPINLRGSIRHIAEFFTYSAILSGLSIWLVPIVAIPAGLCFFINRRKMNWIWNMADNWQNSERQLNYIKNAAGDVSRAKDVRLFSLENLLNKGFIRAFKERMEWYRQQDAWEFGHDTLSVVIMSLGNFAAYAYAIYMVAAGNISPGDFVLYFNSIMRLSGATSDWFNNFSGYQWISNNICYVRDYLEMEDRTNRGEGQPLPGGECEIEFKNVSYKYSGADEATIKNLSFTLRKGEKLALVGHNGAGKTTLVKLMCGLYNPTEGEILLNGVPVNEYNREEYFKLFSTVFQDISPFAATIGENVTGQTDYDKEKLFDCLKKAGIWDKVNSLEKGADTHLVRGVYIDSVDLSGGEMQKLALAKALNKNAPVLLLDEPTAALDAIAEQEMYLNYTKFAEGKSCVFISHRLASTRFCDRIILVENGQVAECGTHSELMEKGGKYAELFALQSSYYNDEKLAEEAGI
ncbi:MAG: ABC transporter ATP-binding protein/permease [Oscillospiraceae bacterium]|nr:ABC transporter ATP-binding protein/permease [Oscillospiraceae bacterium]